jgi:hypothetical protein
MDTGSCSRDVLDCGTLAGTLLVDPGTMDFALVPGLNKGCLGVLSRGSWSLFQRMI